MAMTVAITGEPILSRLDRLDNIVSDHVWVAFSSVFWSIHAMRVASFRFLVEQGCHKRVCPSANILGKNCELQRFSNLYALR